MDKKKSTCCICGSQYEVCHFCPEVANFTPWRRICDTSKHYQIYLVLSEYNGKVLDRTDARKQLERLDVTLGECEKFRPNVYAVIKEIFEDGQQVLDAPSPAMEQKMPTSNDPAENMEQETQVADAGLADPQSKRPRKHKKA